MTDIRRNVRVFTAMALVAGWGGCPGCDDEVGPSSSPAPHNYELDIEAGDDQVAPSGSALPQDLKVHYYDRNNTSTPAPATTITWTTLGDGKIAGQSLQTDP